MGLFQKSVISKYLKNQNKETIDSKWKIYSAHFLNPKVQEEIKGLKEEQYQGEFLEDLFVKILGYTKPASAGETKFNLTTEYKNVKDSKKADGAIVINNKVKAVIELKGTNTTDLGKIEEQAFGYKNNQQDCIYVITSNFEKLRFYIDNAIEHIEFNLFMLSLEEFQMLYLCLGFENISQNTAKKMKDESLSEEDVITKKLYKDYSLFKRELHQNLVELNPDVDPLVLFKKSQKLLDRFLFLFFGEDRNLLPPNSVRLILTQWNQLRDLDEYTPLYGRFKKYFGYLNTGHKGKQHDVFAYNGGLFKPDEVLDAILIDDDLLYRHTIKLSEYDFASEVDVNILGHIFENSLNELDEIKAQLEGHEIDKTKSKRKREGVFYTPKYTTKYMVENTVGKLCNEKKAALKINEEDHFTDRKRTKTTKISLLTKLETYRAWLLQITICDPACGSGAFLNQALDFLITEHHYIDELQAKLFGDALVLSDIENSILENNLFGVDLNEESVEIAKLSLWLRTAQPNRKLNDLSHNIKCGNSLIDEIKVAGEKTFNWHKEFPQEKKKKNEVEIEIVEALPYAPDYLALLQTDAKEAAAAANRAISLSKEAIALSEKAAALSQKVYEYAQQLQIVSEPTPYYGINKGGFDVVIGNPPYVRLETIKEMSEALSKMNYKTFEKRGDLYCLFVERGFEILKKGGFISFIMPNKWMQAGYGKPLRELLLERELIQLIDFGDIQIFEGATTYPCIFISRKSSAKNEVSVSVLTEVNKDDFYTNVIQTAEVFQTSKFSGDTWVISSKKNQQLLERLNKNFKTLADFVEGEAYRGIIPGLSEAFIIDLKIKNELCQNDFSSKNIITPIVRGRNMSRYASPKINDCDFIILAKYNSYVYLETRFPTIYKWLISFEDKLKSRGQCNGSKETIEKPYSGQHHWLELDNCPTDEYLIEFSKPKIMYQAFQVKPCFIHDDNGLYCNNSMWFIPTGNKGLLAVLNSKMGWWLITKYCTQIQNGYQLIWKYFGQIPMVHPSEELATKADVMLKHNKELQEISQKFQRSMQRKFDLDELPKKLQDWYLLSYSDLIKELAKKKVKLSLKEEAEWEDYFNEERKKALELKATLNTTDKAIDEMVYQLYGLNKDEIGMVEEG